MSFVLTPLSKTLEIEFSSNFASLSLQKLYFKAIEKDKIEANGFAIP